VTHVPAAAKITVLQTLLESDKDLKSKDLASKTGLSIAVTRATLTELCKEGNVVKIASLKDLKMISYRAVKKLPATRAKTSTTVSGRT